MGILMGENIIMDRSGRILLPKKVRSAFSTNCFEIRAFNDRIELRPVTPIQGLFGALPDLDVDRIRKEHDGEVSKELPA